MSVTDRYVNAQMRDHRLALLEQRFVSGGRKDGGVWAEGEGSMQFVSGGRTQRFVSRGRKDGGVWAEGEGSMRCVCVRARARVSVLFETGQTCEQRRVTVQNLSLCPCCLSASGD